MDRNHRAERQMVRLETEGGVGLPRSDQHFCTWMCGLKLPKNA